MWFGVLVPMWVRQHDNAKESHSVDRFSTAMRVLSRRTPAGPDRRYVVMPKRPVGVQSPVVDRPLARPQRRPARPPAQHPVRRPVPPTPLTPRAALLARRRRVLRTMLVLLAASVVAAVFVSGLAWVAVGGLVMALAAY